jgi:Galactosyltransferase
MNLLVAIMTCHKLDYFIDDLTIDWCTQQNLRCTDQQARVNTIRATWLKDLPADVDYKFFYGNQLRSESSRRNPKQLPLRAPLDDEIFLECRDNYTANPDKMKAICRWALDNGYDYILRCDDDTFMYPDRLLLKDRPLWEGKDYAGASASNFHPGGCVFLSRRMMELVISEHITTYADDVWMGQIAMNHRIPMVTIPTMRNQWGTGYKVPIDIDPTGISSFHSCTPDVMRRLHVTGKV